MANFRFRIIFEISRQILDQSELEIAQIEAKDKLKVLFFCNLGSFGVKIKRFSKLGKLYTKMELLVSWIRKRGFRGNPRTFDPKIGYLGSF